MPIARFGSKLISEKKFNKYMELLKKNFNKDALKNVMCKNLISIDYLGYVYDCDFNQMLNLNVGGCNKIHISNLKINTTSRKINTGDHCYGCVAGPGSSCTGTLV